MPYADPEKRRQRAREWRQEKIAQGYGKALYARRAHRAHNEQILREAMEKILKACDGAESAKDLIVRIAELATTALAGAPPVGKPRDYMEG